MRLYRIVTQFWGKDLNEKAMLGYVVAQSDEEVAEHINHKYKDGEWFGHVYKDDPDSAAEVEETKHNYITNKGDTHTEYDGEFYDQKHGWEEIREISEDQIQTLRNLGILEELSRGVPVDNQ